MNRFITCTALGLVLGLAPALAQDQAPADDTQAPPAAAEQPALPSEVLPSEPSQPSDPAAPIPGDTSEAPDPALPPSAEAPESEPASPPSAEAPLSEPSSPPAAEAPQPIEPAAPKSAEAPSGTQFLTKQESTDYLASNLIGESIYDSQDEVIGSINDLVTDQGGKVVAVLIGSGGFLGMGQKEVALRFEDLKFSRDEGNDVKVIANLSKEMIASAPDYEKLSEQSVAVGSETQQ